jgi:hypothetical protein
LKRIAAWRALVGEPVGLPGKSALNLNAQHTLFEPDLFGKPSVRESAFFASATLFSILRLNCT